MRPTRSRARACFGMRRRAGARSRAVKRAAPPIGAPRGRGAMVAGRSARPETCLIRASASGYRLDRMRPRLLRTGLWLAGIAGLVVVAWLGWWPPLARRGARAARAARRWRRPPAPDPRPRRSRPRARRRRAAPRADDPRFEHSLGLRRPREVRKRAARQPLLAARGADRGRARAAGARRRARALERRVRQGALGHRHRGGDPGLLRRTASGSPPTTSSSSSYVLDHYGDEIPERTSTCSSWPGACTWRAWRRSRGRPRRRSSASAPRTRRARPGSPTKPTSTEPPRNVTDVHFSGLRQPV